MSRRRVRKEKESDELHCTRGGFWSLVMVRSQLPAQPGLIRKHRAGKRHKSKVIIRRYVETEVSR